MYTCARFSVPQYHLDVFLLLLSSEVLKEILLLLPSEVIQVLVPLLSHCHAAFQESHNALPMGPYFPRRGHKLPPLGLKAGTRPSRPMVQMAVPHGQLEAAKVVVIFYWDIKLFIEPVEWNSHSFTDLMCLYSLVQVKYIFSCPMKLHPWTVIHYTCGRYISAILERMQGNPYIAYATLL